MNDRLIEAIYPLTPQQQGMLFETLFAPESGIFIEQEVYTWQFPIDSKIFRRAWQRIVDRHAILRTAFVWKEQDTPLQVVFRRVDIHFDEEDWRELPMVEQQQRLERYLAGTRRQGFDVARPPLMRLALFRLRDNTYQFVWSQHHILMDGWCRPLIFKEFETLYRAFYLGQEPSLEEPRPYRDYINWLNQQDLSAAESFWRERLRGFAQPTPLGRLEASISASQKVEKYGMLEGRLSAQETEALQNLSRKQRVTFNTLLQGIWTLLLCRYSGENDVLFGTTVSGRPVSLPNASTIIGLFINTLPFRVHIQPEANLWVWLKELQNQHLECREYEYCSTGQIHQWSQLPGALPLYESLLVFENYPGGTQPVQPAARNDVSRWQGVGAHTSYALTILAGIAGEFFLRFVFDGRRLEQDDTARIRGHFLTLLRSVVARPQQRLETLLAQIDDKQIPRFYPSGQVSEQGEEKPFVAPRTPTQILVATIWKELLKVEQVGLHANFFELGGHSLLAMQLVSRIRETFKIEFPLRHLFEAPTLEALALVIEEILIEEIEAIDDAEAARLAQ
jgi:acyl carrier protein